MFNSLKARFASCIFQNDDSNDWTRMKYTYILENTYSNKSNVQLRTIGQSRIRLLDRDSDLCIYHRKPHKKQSTRPWRFEAGEWTCQNTQIPLLKKEDFSYYYWINRAGCRNNHAIARKERLWLAPRWKLSLHRRHWNPRSTLYR